jgi:hypothetical protein
MKIILRQEEYGFLLDMLGFIDGKSYDPLYKTVAGRVRDTAVKEGADCAIFIEESEVYAILDASEEYLVDAESGNHTAEEKKIRTAQCKNAIAVVEEETGLSV